MAHALSPPHHLLPWRHPPHHQMRQLPYLVCAPLGGAAWTARCRARHHQRVPVAAMASAIRPPRSVSATTRIRPTGQWMPLGMHTSRPRHRLAGGVHRTWMVMYVTCARKGGTRAPPAGRRALLHRPMVPSAVDMVFASMVKGSSARSQPLARVFVRAIPLADGMGWRVVGVRQGT